MGWLETLFLGAFLFGLVMTVLSVLLGSGHLGLGHHGLHLPRLDGAHGGDGVHFAPGAHGGAGVHGAPTHAGGVGEGHGGTERSASMSPFNLTALTAFVAWFGGAGYLALTGWELAAGFALLLAGVAGLVGWLVVQLFFTRVLPRADSSMDPADYRIEGTVARVSMPLAPGRTGEIQYTLGGTRHSDGARSSDGTPIPHGAEVVVVRYERGIAYVQPWESYLEDERGPDEGAATGAGGSAEGGSVPEGRIGGM